mmetsp:Transcript_14702/g.31512  ORF Transcript_14702/g.31512 Transcript_14702/m.31512 type:complete len:345 (-) Transcript_14702:2535-3569(-)
MSAQTRAVCVRSGESGSVMCGSVHLKRESENFTRRNAENAIRFRRKRVVRRAPEVGHWQRRNDLFEAIPAAFCPGFCAWRAVTVVEAVNRRVERMMGTNVKGSPPTVASTRRSTVVLKKRLAALCCSSRGSSLSSSSPERSNPPAEEKYTVAGMCVRETVIKKSRFVTSVASISTREQAESFLCDARDDTASHNCFAYKASAANAERCSDDGEPSGTAGRPILGAITTLGLDQVVVLVTRYYGGVKLGAGGLVRAYNSCAADALRAAEKALIPPPLVSVRLAAPYEQMATLFAVTESFRERSSPEYAPDTVSLQLSVPADQVEQLRVRLANSSRGQATLEVMKD